MSVDVKPLDASAVRAEAHNAESSWQLTYVQTTVVLDVVIAACIALLVGAIRFGPVSAQRHLHYMVGAAVFPVLWVLVLYLAKAYEPRYLFIGGDEYQRVIFGGITLMACSAFVAYATRAELGRSYVLLGVPAVTVLDGAARFGLRRVLRRLRAQGRCMRRVVVVGYERAVATMCRRLAREPFHGLAVVGACLPPHRPSPETLADVGVPVVGTFANIAEASCDVAADVVAVLPSPEMDAEALRRLAWRLETMDTDLLVAPTLLDAAGPRTTIRPVDGLPLLHVEHPQFTGWRRAVKGAFDSLASLGLLVLCLPLFVLVAVVIRLEDGGPVIFKQERIGRGGAPFTMYKFRTMRADAEDHLADVLALNEHDGVLFKIRNDPRITRWGRLLRRYSLDELPQLWNVLTGSMSLVGPRPPLPREVERYEDDARRRLVVKPGMTGLWQVSGRANLAWDESVRLDLRYVENWSLAFDIVILLQTARAVIRSAGAY